MSEAPEGAPGADSVGPGRLVRFTGPALAGAILAGSALLHHGLGPRTGDAWSDARGFLLGWFPSELGPALGLGVLPILALCAAVFATTRSALTRSVAVFGTLAAACFVFYGVAASGVWSFFGWRWSVCMLLFAAIVGLAVMAPLFAAEWREQSWTQRALAYLPFALFLIAFERNVTGTDPELAFAISPWPVVQIFGIELSASFVAALLLGSAAGLLGLSKRRMVPAIAGGTAAIAFPFAILWIGSRSGLLPFTVGAGTLVLCVAVALLVLAVVALPVVQNEAAAGRRAAHLALGGILLGVPLALGQVLTRLDYTATRDGRAQQVIDALASYFEREETYPETLDELVTAGLLESVPTPRIGFGAGQQFVYQNLGTDYLLEFSATRWIQCAYNPPWTDDELEEEGGEEEMLGGSWSCPTRPPELW